MRTTLLVTLALAGCSTNSVEPPDGSADGSILPDAAPAADAADAALEADASGVACTGAPPPPQSGTGTVYHVSPSGSDSNAGTATAPFATIAHAAGLVNPGDTVLVEDGDYVAASANGPVVEIDRGGTSTNWVWFKAVHRGGAKIDGQGNTAAQGFNFGAGSGFVRIEGFEIFGEASAGLNLNAGNGGHDVQIVANDIHDIGRLCSDTTYGMDGIYIGQPNITIEENRIHDIGRFPPGQNGCQLTTQNYQNHDHAIYIGNYGSGTLGGLHIINNLIYRCPAGWGVQLYPGALHDVEVLNNTFAFPNPWRDGQIVVYSPSIDGSFFENNIFYMPANSMFSIGTASFSTTVVANNVTTAPAVFNASTPSGITLTANQLGTDPLLTNPTANDFTLTSGSPAIGAGATLAQVPYDFNGCPRSAPYDVGAFRFAH